MSTSIIPYERSTLVNNEKYIVLDVHQATISIAVMDSTGKVVMESILETKAATILKFFAGLRVRRRVELLYQQLDGLQALRQQTTFDFTAITIASLCTSIPIYLTS